MAPRVPGVSQIKTIAALRGSGVHSGERHVHQFQIASLELEKSRRTREREATMKRVSTLDARLAEIEATIRKHQDALGIPGAVPEGPAAQTRTAATEKRRTLRY